MILKSQGTHKNMIALVVLSKDMIFVNASVSMTQYLNICVVGCNLVPQDMTIDVINTLLICEGPIMYNSVPHVLQPNSKSTS